MNLRDHAVKELRLAGASIVGDGFRHVMELIDALLAQGHEEGGNTMKVVISTFYQLANFETLTPLQGTDDEWEQLNPHLYRNVRCGRVFKELGVGCYDSQATIFVDDQNRMFTRQPQSRRMVAFPYTPQTTFVRVKTGPQLIVPKGATRQ
jgi:hypothetical protein